MDIISQSKNYGFYHTQLCKRKWGTGNRKQGTGTGNREQETGNREQETGNGKQLIALGTEITNQQNYKINKITNQQKNDKK